MNEDNGLVDYDQQNELLPTSPVKINNLTEMSKEIFNSNYRVGWWNQQDLDSLIRPTPLPKTNGKTTKFSKEGSTLIASKLMLVVSETAEAMEGMRKGLMDEHLGEEEMFGVELADVIIRVLDLAGATGVDIGRLVSEKYNYNQQRADHKPENRALAGGKSI